MKTQISRRDWQRLSAYIDGQITSSEQDRLEARLENEPALQVALDDLRAMKQKLGELPKLRAPRNFTLTPEMVIQRRYMRRYNSLRLASAVAGILLVLVFVGDNVRYDNAALPPAPEAQRLVDEFEMPAEEPDATAAAGEGLNAVESETASDEDVDDAVVLAEKQTNADEPVPESRQEPTQGVDSGIPPRDPVPIRPVVVLEIILMLTAMISGLGALSQRYRGRR